MLEPTIDLQAAASQILQKLPIFWKERQIVRV